MAPATFLDLTLFEQLQPCFNILHFREVFAAGEGVAVIRQDVRHEGLFAEQDQQVAGSGQLSGDGPAVVQVAMGAGEDVGGGADGFDSVGLGLFGDLCPLLERLARELELVQFAEQNLVGPLGGVSLLQDLGLAGQCRRLFGQ